MKEMHGTLPLRTTCASPVGTTDTICPFCDESFEFVYDDAYEAAAGKKAPASSSGRRPGRWPNRSRS